MSGVHVAVAYYDMQAQQVTCIFDAETASCDPEATPSAGTVRVELTLGAAASARADRGADPDDRRRHGRPERHAAAAGHHRAAHAHRAGEHPAHRRRRAAAIRHLQHRHADRRLDRPDDGLCGDVQPAARHRGRARSRPAPGSASSARRYGGKINSLWTAATLRKDLFPGNDAQRGFAAIKSTLSELYGIDIKYYVSVNFEGFREIVDALGGVTINVQLPVTDDKYPGDDGRLRRVYIPTGIQHMDGAQALIYARSRNSSDDFDRAQRQQRVLLSLRQQADVGSLIEKLPQLVKALRNAVHTDMPIELLPGLLRLAGDIDTSKIRSYVFAPPRLRPGLRERPDRAWPRLRDHPERQPDPGHGRERVRPRSRARGAPGEGRRRARGRVGRLGHRRPRRRRRARRLPRAARA